MLELCVCRDARMAFSHARHAIAVVPPAQLRWNQTIGNELWLAHEVREASMTYTTRHAWSQVLSSARKRGELHVAVLGTSTSAGCGACDFSTFTHCETCQAKARTNIALETDASPRAHSDECVHRKGSCIANLAWTSTMESLLRASLRKQLRIPRLQLTVTARNAVSAGFYAHCTERWVNKDVHIVLLEVAANLFGGPTELQRLLVRVRHAAPHAVIAFVMWPPRVNAVHASTTMGINEDTWDQRSGIAAAAASFQADLLRVHVLLARLRVFLEAPAFYAQRGNDRIHPNPLGHEVLARFAAAFVVQQLHLSDEGATNGSPVQSQPALLSYPTLRYDSSGDGGGFEQCFDAPHLPLTASEGWQLVDEGVHKGVPKLGWRSNIPNATLKLEPIGPKPSDISAHTCNIVAIDIGYLLRHSAEQGALYLSCMGGCDCIPEQSLTAGFNPFPRVVTNAHETPITDLRSGNLSVTVSTRFYALWRSAPSCSVTVRHMRADDATSTVSTVRVDNLAISTLGTLGMPLVPFYRRVTGLSKKYAAGLRLMTKFSQLPCGLVALVDECRTQVTSATDARFCHDVLNASAPLAQNH